MGNPAGGLLLLLLAIFLLVQFFAGRLDWLFNLRAAVDTSVAGTPPATPGPSGPALSVVPRTRVPANQQS